MNEGESGLAALEPDFGVDLSAEQKHQVRVYVEMLRHWNARINLTSIDRVDESTAELLRGVLGGARVSSGWGAAGRCRDRRRVPGPGYEDLIGPRLT